MQNVVPYGDLGAATSGVTFFRSIGGSFGTAIFGAIFANVLTGNLASHLHGVTLPKGFTSADVTPAVLSHLPAAVHQGFVTGYAESIQTVFLVAVPIAALAFLATWLIPQVELRRWPEADAAVPEAELTMASVTAAPEPPAQAQETAPPADASARSSAQIHLSTGSSRGATESAAHPGMSRKVGTLSLFCPEN